MMRRFLPFVIFGLFLWFYPWQVLKTNDYYRIQKIKKSEFDSDSIIIGDSRLRNLRLKGYQNLSIAGIGIPETYSILNQILSSRSSVVKVIICLDPQHLMDYNHFEVLQRDNPIDEVENQKIIDLAIQKNDSLYIIKPINLLEKIRFNGLIGEISNRIRMPIYTFKDFKEYYFSNGDYLCHSKKNSLKPIPDDQPWSTKSPSPLNHFYGVELFKLLHKYPKIQVTWVIPERYGKYNSDFLANYKSWIEKMGGNPRWCNMAEVVTNDDFFDQKHLNCNGLEKVVKQLGY